MPTKQRLREKLFLGLKMWHKNAKNKSWSFLVILVGEWKLHWFSRKGVLQTRNSLLLPCALLQFAHKFTSPKNNVRIPCRPKLCEAKLNVSYTSVTCFGGQCLAMHTDFFQWLASRPVSSCKSWNPKFPINCCAKCIAMSTLWVAQLDHLCYCHFDICSDCRNPTRRPRSRVKKVIICPISHHTSHQGRW